MLPTIQTADAAIGALVYIEAYRIAFTPHDVLGMGRLEFPMASQDATLTSDKQQRAIGRAACLRITFNDTDDHVDARPPCRLAQTIRCRAWNFDGIGQVLSRCLPPQR